MKANIKAVAVTLCIILICGGLLAILSDLFKVDENERIQRAINSIYTDETVNFTGEQIEIEDVTFEEGTVKACYVLDNGDYLILSTGKKGYSNGTVTVYVAIENVNNVATVKKVVLNDYKGQTLMSKLTGIYERFIGKTEETAESIEIVSGATRSSTATSNAVNVAVKFAQYVLGR